MEISDHANRVTEPIFRVDPRPRRVVVGFGDLCHNLEGIQTSRLR